MEKNFNEFMSETKQVNRWFVVKVAIGGAFTGALLAVFISMVGLV
jgi:hypothetical protein